jgi:tetratricopeptide (TPR) repeat protein
MNRSEEAAPEAGNAEQRLDGWKRIAQFLNRDVRTVRRWEKSQGLPVRRVMHDKGATVYAYRQELETWLKEQDRRKKTAPVSSTKLYSPDRRTWWWPALAGALLALAAVGWWFSSHQPKIQFGEWDWALITAFDNRTGEQLLDGTLEYALQRDLGNSAYVKVVPRERVIDALQLMRLTRETPVDENIGREISLRDGAIRVLITGRIDKLGDAYTLSATLMNPEDGVTMASFTAEAVNQSELLKSIGSISRNVRVALGEGLDSIRGSEQKLAPVTTPSLQALKLYSDADLLMSNGSTRREALPLLEEAVRIDPDFASAHVLLYYSYTDLERDEQANRHLERAVELAETTSERERLFILSTYYGNYLKDIPKSNETNELLARLYPDHFWAASNLSSRYTLEQEHERAHSWLVRRAELRPNLEWVQIEAWISALILGRDENIQQFRRRTGILADKSEWTNAHYGFIPIYELWLKGDFDDAFEQLELLVGDKEPSELADDSWTFAHLRSFYLLAGQWNLFRETSDYRSAVGWLQIIAELDSGDPSSLNRYLKNVTAGNYWDAVMFTLAGQFKAAEQIIADPDAPGRLSGMWRPREFMNLANGQLALARGQYEQAIGYLENSAEFSKLIAMPHYYFARRAQAQALQALGRTEDAIEVLVRDSNDYEWTLFEPSATYFWMRNQLLLWDLYRRADRSEEAAIVETELRSMLRLADPEHPILKGLDAA